MRMAPVRTRPTARRLWVWLLMKDIGLRAKLLQGDPDVWIPEPLTPLSGSPWEATRALEPALVQAGHHDIIPMVEFEVRLRLETARDNFHGIRAAARTRRAYSLYALSRATIEACAFASWVLDPDTNPAERLLRGMLLRRQGVNWHLKSVRSMAGKPPDWVGPYLPSEVNQVLNTTEEHRSEIEQAIGFLCAALESQGCVPPRKPPRMGQRMRQLLCDEMGLPQGYDAYHLMSGVTHSEAFAILGTWRADRGKPSISYATLLDPLHLALCSLSFTFERRATCWGGTHKDSGLLKIIRRIEYIITGEPGIIWDEPAPDGT